VTKEASPSSGRAQHRTLRSTSDADSVRIAPSKIDLDTSRNIRKQSHEIRNKLRSQMLGNNGVDLVP
jgi:hypothetical protein